jgi:hypothetical protein
MTELIEKTTIACPLAQAAMQVNRFFADHTGGDGNAHVPLRLPLHLPGRNAPLVLEQVVVATVVPDREPGQLTPRYRLTWTPAERSESYPAFEGELRVESEDYDSFVLGIHGHYTPPMGIAGAAFDFAVGRFIAAATARDLLHRIRADVEGAFQAAEARKRERTASSSS